MEPDAPGAALNLADLYRAQGREPEAQALIRSVLARQPGNAAARHALGLSLVRQQKYAEALGHLRRAAELEPDNRAYARVYQLARERR